VTQARKGPSARGQTPRRGFRSSRRTTRTGRAWRRHDLIDRLREKSLEGGKSTLLVVAAVGAGLAVGILLVWVAISGINVLSRWYLQKTALSSTEVKRRQQARDNVLFIAVKDGRATGYLAARVQASERRVFGIAIPEGAFVEVPGQGFEQIGDAYRTGAGTAKSAVSNYLSVPFERYVVIPYDAYQRALATQSMAGITAKVLATDIAANDLQVFGSTLDAIPSKDVALVPLPVKPIAVGGQRFFQPQRDQVADLIKTWWGVDVRSAPSKTVLVENGAGKPGVAGSAAEQLIAGGFTVVDTKNANGFDYKKTLILLYRGSARDASRVRDLLGVGELRRGDDNQGLADIIVVIGKDYRPPSAK